CLQYASYPRTF
nr:immunoglobulin light chain junction region [Mus musculus]NSL97754.1 immunoglobulin light chain junction region [Mus musculus]NSL98761.1 immunoglobulin light chain junction region [Mus musculus]NSL98806.1 immunoglobulin light chain junction region [Mus musculus]NSL98946.1 immunoglobulin light chain junction region [Mus musculus]